MNYHLQGKFIPKFKHTDQTIILYSNPVYVCIRKLKSQYELKVQQNCLNVYKTTLLKRAMPPSFIY